ncbi:hypothetical protein I302_100912 [Kwoniella bestiolae CBS 10118]|uniref:Uncharacterized protein n=1 Tax=Kwoniella bestiolae CBS 10118 TaxID=1296100 RepID=A0A1B9G6I1_9TREE|nr:hypothetical protein I302_04288 [Kwoniella bestiolae CBS 10118]OCF26602.1 hypothetical protein I302_04288 [Kwoniella bestiolae CBS 10118]
MSSDNMFIPVTSPGTSPIIYGGSSKDSTQDSVILLCPKVKNASNVSEVFALSRSGDTRTQQWVSVVGDGIRRAMDEAWNKCVDEKSIFSTIGSADIARETIRKLPSTIESFIRGRSKDDVTGGKPDAGRISIQTIPSESYGSLMKIRTSQCSAGRIGVIVIPEKSHSARNEEISRGGKLSNFAILHPSVRFSREERISALKKLSRYSNCNEEEIERRPLKRLSSLTERLINSPKEYNDCGFVFLEEQDIGMFQSLMDELPDASTRWESGPICTTGSTARRRHGFRLSSPLKHFSAPSESSLVPLIEEESDEEESD